MPKSSGFSSHPKERSSRPLKSLNSVFRRDSASASTSSAASKPRGKIGPPAAANANATGYAKRQERRAQKVGSASSATFLDAYEYDGPGRGGGKNSLGRRMNVGLEVDKDELVGQNGPQSAKSTKRSKNDEDEDSGNGSDGEESGAATLRRKITANMEADFGVVESEDDESLDSDEAFEGESDEEKFSNFKFAANKNVKSSLKPPHPRMSEVNLDEDENTVGLNGDAQSDDDDDDDENEEEGPTISLSAMLDGNAGASGEENEMSENEEDSVSESEGDEENAEGPLAESDSENEVANEEDALAKLDSFIGGLGTNLSAKKRKAVDENQPENEQQALRRKRRVLPERTEAGAENEFAAIGGSTDKITLDDLLKPLASSKSQTLLSLDKSAQILAPSSMTSSSSRSKRTDTLAAPLHTRAQERVDREAAYEATKEEVEKWAPTMKRIKEADHLSFPLQKPAVEKPSTAQMTSTFQPSTELESAVDRLLTSAKLRETDLEKTEELQMSHLTLEEVAARRAELRHMRELLFRADIKAKRVAKIKSKTYRRIQKKQRERNTLTVEQVGMLDPEAAQEERMKAEVERARERASLRHKNTGKWARQVMGRGKDVDVDQRKELNEQLERGERLRRRIQGLGDDDSEDEDDDESDGDRDSRDEDPESKIAARAFDELATLNDSLSTLDPLASKGKKKLGGIMNMKFMRDAAVREEAEVDKVVDDFRAELVGLSTEGEDIDMVGGDTDETPQSLSVNVQGNAGRMVFRPSIAIESTFSRPSPPSLQDEPASQLPTPIIAASDTSSVTLRSSEPDVSPSFLSNRPLAPQLSSTSTPIENPWLTIGSSSSSKLSKRKNEIALSKQSSTSTKSAAQLKKDLRKTEEALMREAEDAVVDIDLDDVMKVPDFTISSSGDAAEAKGITGKKNGKGNTKVRISEPHPKATVDTAFRDSDDEGDDGQDGAVTNKNSGKAFKQRDLVALAFAGDNVVEEFNTRKQREIEAEAPKDIDTTLPGWGSWGGRGVKKGQTKSKPHLIKHIPGVAPTARADAGKAHLIISEKKDKKASKYLVKDLPHPYTSQAQFERSLSVPVGAEWNTRTAFQKGTLPKVVTKMGTVIDPIQKLF